MTLEWNAVGESYEGYRAEGGKGTWRTIPYSNTWLLSLQPKFSRGMLPHGDYPNLAAAQTAAQTSEHTAKN